MAARESAQVLAALSDVLGGMTRHAAAVKHAVAPSSITRAMQRRDMPELRPGRPRVPVPADAAAYRFADGTPHAGP